VGWLASAIVGHNGSAILAMASRFTDGSVSVLPGSAFYSIEHFAMILASGAPWTTLGLEDGFLENLIQDDGMIALKSLDLAALVSETAKRMISIAAAMVKVEPLIDPVLFVPDD
jgi:hypothetical protein